MIRQPSKQPALMATLSQIYTNLGIGVIVATASCLAFGAAVQFDLNRNLTPRAWARPVSVVKNVLSRPYSLGWIVWSLSLKDVDLLSGIPGTGTRNQGRSGPTLRTNLDGILMLRYHTLQCKVRTTTKPERTEEGDDRPQSQVKSNRPTLLIRCFFYSTVIFKNFPSLDRWLSWQQSFALLCCFHCMK